MIRASDDSMMDRAMALLADLQRDPIWAVARYYASCLTESPKAIEYVEQQLKLSPEEAAEQGIGFSDRTLGTLIPSNRIKAGRMMRSQLVELGVYKSNGRETLRGYVTVPIKDNSGTVTGIRGYKLDRHADGPVELVVDGSGSHADFRSNGSGSHADFRSNGSGSHADFRSAQPSPSDSITAEPETTSASGACVDPGAPGLTSSVTEELTVEDGSLVFRRGERLYRIRGLEKNTSSTSLKVKLLVSMGSRVHLDILDLVQAKARAAFTQAAAAELELDQQLIKADLSELLLQLESLQADLIAKLKEPKVSEVKLTSDEQAAALELLRDPRLLDRIVSDLGACGLVGEASGKLAAYLCATSRKLPSPLAVLIQSSSSAGKSSLMDAVLAMMPPEEVLRLSGLSAQSLYYLPDGALSHKILAISEDGGLAEAAYALKLLQSEGELHFAAVGRGEGGRVQTNQHRVAGPVQIFFTTTAARIDEELANRALVLAVDEGEEQTAAIHAAQRAAWTLAAHQRRTTAAAIRRLHQNAQRLLEPLLVINPYAAQLSFPRHQTRARRDHAKYLSLIASIAYLRQYQRKSYPLDVPEPSGPTHYIFVDRDDIAVANRLAGEIFGRSLDELSPQSRNLLGLLHRFAETEARERRVPREAFRFTRRDARAATHWSDFALQMHLRKLVELEYALIYRSGRGGRHEYELLYRGEGSDGERFLLGLCDAGKLQHPASYEATHQPERVSVRFQYKLDAQASASPAPLAPAAGLYPNG